MAGLSNLGRAPKGLADRPSGAEMKINKPVNEVRKFEIRTTLRHPEVSYE